MKQEKAKKLSKKEMQAAVSGLIHKSKVQDRLNTECAKKNEEYNNKIEELEERMIALGKQLAKLSEPKGRKKKAPK